MRFRLHFDDPGFFLNDPRVEVRLDDRTLYTGGFKGGFDVSVDIEPGRHVLETAIFLGEGGLARRRRIPLDLDPESGYRDVPHVAARLEYSRFWGNFKKRVSIAVQI